MIKVSLFYSNEAGKKFDMDYYFNKRLPMVRQRLGTTCKCVDAEQGQSGRTDLGDVGSETTWGRSNRGCALDKDVCFLHQEKQEMKSVK